MTREQKDALNDMKAACGRFLAAFRGTGKAPATLRAVDALYRSLPDVQVRPLVLIHSCDRPEVRELRKRVASHYLTNGKGA